MGRKLKLKRHESFLLREGWIQKYLYATNDFENIFYKNDGIKILGIGSNMVKSLKFWLTATDIIRNDRYNSLTDFGELIKRYDPYLDSTFTISLLHYKLCSSKGKMWENIENPVFVAFFNYFNGKSFTKDEAYDYIFNFFKNQNFDFNGKSLEADLNILFRTYLNSDYDKNPEENYYSPLSKLNLLQQKDKSRYEKTNDKHLGLSPLVIYYCLCNIYKKNFEIGDAFINVDSPVRLFNLDRNTFNHYLMQLQKMGYVTINKTAGLDMVYINKKIKLSEIFAEYFGGNKNV